MTSLKWEEDRKVEWWRWDEKSQMRHADMSRVLSFV